MPELRHIHQIVKLVNVETSQCKEVDNLSESCHSECTMLLSTRTVLIESGYKSNCRMCRCGNSTLWKCGDVVDPHCGNVEMWWIHIFSVAVHINFEFIQELT